MISVLALAAVFALSLGAAPASASPALSRSAIVSPAGSGLILRIDDDDDDDRRNRRGRLRRYFDDEDFYDDDDDDD